MRRSTTWGLELMRGKSTEQRLGSCLGRRDGWRSYTGLSLVKRGIDTDATSTFCGRLERTHYPCRSDDPKNKDGTGDVTRYYLRDVPL